MEHFNTIISVKDMEVIADFMEDTMGVVDFETVQAIPVVAASECEKVFEVIAYGERYVLCMADGDIVAAS